MAPIMVMGDAPIAQQPAGGKPRAAPQHTLRFFPGRPRQTRLSRGIDGMIRRSPSAINATALISPAQRGARDGLANRPAARGNAADDGPPLPASGRLYLRP